MGVFRIRVVAVGAALVLVAGLGAAAGQEAPPSGFADTAGNAHEANIDYVVWWGIAQGVSATEYRPAAPVTRAQMGSFLARMIGHGPRPLPDNPPAAFDDTAGSPHAANIDALAAAGIVRGIAARTYGPHLTVTREQMTSFLVRAWEYATGEPLAASGDRFTDIATSAHRDNINKAAAAGFASGTSATTFSPSLPVRRDQMASFIARTVRRMVDHGHATHPDDATAPPAPPIERPWWRSLGVVVDTDDFGVTGSGGEFGVNDIKVAQRPDGTYVAVVVSHNSEAAWFHVIESDDLVSWAELARFDMEPALQAGFYIGSLLALPDGTLKMIGVSDGDGDPVVSSTSTDGGLTWSADPGPLLTVADFDRDVRLTTLAVLERPEGGWRMYVNANECDQPNAMGGDNCPDDVALSTWDLGTESIFSAVSDDLLTWTVEPGLRFRGSRTNGSLNHPAVWADDDGRVRLTGATRWSPASQWSEMGPYGHAMGELVSDDGLTFHAAAFRHIGLPLSDPQVVHAPDGSLRMLAGAPGVAQTDQRGQIRLLERTSISWEVEPATPRPVTWQVPSAEQPDDPYYLWCFPIHVRGSGTLQVEVRAAGWPWTPGSAPAELWRSSHATLTPPETFHVKRNDTFDHPMTSWAASVVLTDAYGTSWFVTPFGHAEHGDPGEVWGHDLDSMPCPP